MERLLEGAVEHGATVIRDRLQPIMPADMLLTEDARARGFRLDGYGVFFDVEVPSLEGTLPWSFRTLDQNDLGLDAALRTLRSYVQSAGNDVNLQQALKRVELQVAPMTVATTGQPTPTAVQASNGAGRRCRVRTRERSSLQQPRRGLSNRDSRGAHRCDARAQPQPCNRAWRAADGRRTPKRQSSASRHRHRRRHRGAEREGLRPDRVPQRRNYAPGGPQPHRSPGVLEWRHARNSLADRAAGTRRCLLRPEHRSQVLAAGAGRRHRVGRPRCDQRAEQDRSLHHVRVPERRHQPHHDASGQRHLPARRRGRGMGRGISAHHRARRGSHPAPNPARSG